jgi:hypothetical protein
LHDAEDIEKVAFKKSPTQRQKKNEERGGGRGDKKGICGKAFLYLFIPGMYLHFLNVLVINGRAKAHFRRELIHVFFDVYDRLVHIRSS